MCLQVNRVANRAEGRGGPFIAPRRNLSVGVSETRTCRGWGSNMFVKGPVLGLNPG
jgi:hypothetical protein